jgi:hypothetical protein
MLESIFETSQRHDSRQVASDNEDFLSPAPASETPFREP